MSRYDAWKLDTPPRYDAEDLDADQAEDLDAEDLDADQLDQLDQAEDLDRADGTDPVTDPPDLHPAAPGLDH